MLSYFACVYPNDELKLSSESFGYDEISALVGGWIEFVCLSEFVSLYVNETGKLDGLPVNRVATAIARFINPDFHDVIVGNAIFCGPANAEGEDTFLLERVALEIVWFYKDLLSSDFSINLEDFKS